MRKEADILVLDEPTASMDAEAEVKIFERFRELTDDKIAIVISHRFSTVRTPCWWRRQPAARPRQHCSRC